MSYKKAVLLYGIAMILQFSLLNLFSINGVTPNLILCLMVFITYKYNDGLRPALVAIPFALLSDLVGGQYVGVSGLALFFLALLVNHYGRGLNRESIWTLLTVSAIGTVMYNFIYWLIMITLGNASTVLDLIKFLAVALPANLLVVLFVFFVYTRVNKRRGRPKSYGLTNMQSSNKRMNKMNTMNKMKLRNTR
jgi:rod shape-determining protein MreD